MRHICLLFLFSFLPSAPQAAKPQLPADDAVRIREFYGLPAHIQDDLWPAWSKTPAPLLLVTPDTEFLTHHPEPPAAFQKIGDDLYARSRTFSPNLLATFPAFGPPAVIVIGEPARTLSKTSTPWLFTVMHEHFHQLQDGQPGYFDAVNALGLSRGDTTGMWMLNYPFPYDKPEVAHSFAALRDLLVQALAEKDSVKFAGLAKTYIDERNKFLAQLSADDHKYFSFQLWQEGIARYTEIRTAEAAEKIEPSPEFRSLGDYESFSSYAARVRQKTLDELKQADLANWKRVAVYSFGASEGFLLDRIHPTWREEYFRHPFSTDSYFVISQ